MLFINKIESDIIILNQRRNTMETKIKFNPSSLPIATVMNKIKKLYIEGKDGLDLQPSYQRGYVWMNLLKKN